jgi:iron complex outermembrane recepter protein
LPFSPSVLLRVAGNFADGGAYVYNLPTQDYWGDNRDKAGRVTLLLKPFDGFTNTTMAQYDTSSGTSVPNILTSVYKCGTPGAETLIDCSTTGGASAALAQERSHGFYTSDLNTFEWVSANSYLLTNTTQYDFNENNRIKNIFGMSRTYSAGPYDYDATPFPLLNNGLLFPNGTTTDQAPEIYSTTQYQEELQAQGDVFDDRLNYTAGLYYSHERDYNNAPVLFFNAFQSDQNSANVESTKAVYFQGTYKINDKFSVTGGIRDTQDDVELIQLTHSQFGPGIRESTATNQPSWTVSLDYQMTPNTMLYAVSRASYRAGGFDASGAPIEASAATGGNEFKPEKVKDLEIGIKSSGRLGSMPFRFNADLFNSWVTDAQRVVYVFIGNSAEGLVLNARSVDIRGMDANFEIKPLPWLTVGGASTYTDAYFKQPQVGLLGNIVTFGPFGYAPKWSNSLYGVASYDLPNKEGTLSLRGDIYAQSKYYISNFDSTSNPDSGIDGYGVVNMRLSWAQIFNTRLSASLEVRNLFDKQYYVGGLAEGSDLGVNSFVPGRPRWFVGELRYNF